MKLEDLVSIIVPVYNVESYVGKCMESICCQSHTNLDIIVVNDGSKDSSATICEEYARRDSRIRVIHKENAGLGMARNTGLEYIKGKYVAFVDSDDFVSPDYVEKMLCEIHKKEADTCYAGYYEYYNDESIIEKKANYGGLDFVEKQVIEKVLLGMIGTEPSSRIDFVLPMSVWHALYSSEIITKNNVRFPSEREYISEDIIFHIAYLKYSKKVCFIKDCVYYYRCNNNNSLTHSFKENEFERNIQLVMKIEEELSKILDKKQFERQTQRLLLGRFRTCTQKAVSHSRTNNNFQLNLYIKSWLRKAELVDCISSYPIMQNPLKQLVFNYFVLKKNTTGIIILAYVSGIGKNRRF